MLRFAVQYPMQSYTPPPTYGLYIMVRLVADEVEPGKRPAIARSRRDGLDGCDQVDIVTWWHTAEIEP